MLTEVIVLSAAAMFPVAFKFMFDTPQGTAWVRAVTRYFRRVKMARVRAAIAQSESGDHPVP
jgi:hypothetical protein